MYYLWDKEHIYPVHGRNTLSDMCRRQSKQVCDQSHTDNNLAPSQEASSSFPIEVFLPNQGAELESMSQLR